MDTTLIVPGLHGSGPNHWQSWFELRIPGCIRVIQSDWDDPYLPHWSARVRRQLNRAPGSVWIVAHSFGCLAAVQAGADYRERIAGLMMVAPADPERFRVEDAVPDRVLGFPSLVVASSNDPWIEFDQAAHWASVWGSDLIDLGDAGHINVASGHGPWPEGLALLDSLRCRGTAVRQRPLPYEDMLQELGEITWA